jgi:hypothetical protein
MDIGGHGHQIQFLWICSIRRSSFDIFSSRLQRSQFLICNEFNMYSRIKIWTAAAIAMIFKGKLNYCKM